MTPVRPLTRTVFVVGLCLTAATGPVLFALPDRTEEYWAWTIAHSPTAAFFGAAYTGAAVMLALAARATAWQRARLAAVAAFTLTSLALLATLVDHEPFSFSEGGVTAVVAWIWLAVYAVLPPLVLAAFVLQERRGGAREYGVEYPARGWTRLAFGGAGGLLAILGLGLLVGWEWLTTRWPWPLPPLPAAVLGGWLCTFAACFLWFALRDPDWRRARIAALPSAVVAALNLVAAARLRDDFDGGAATVVYVLALAAVLAAILAAVVVEERRLRVAA